MKIIFAIILVVNFTLLSALPTGPGGESVSELCKKTQFENSQMCVDFANRNGSSRESICDLSCYIGIPVEGCGCDIEIKEETTIMVTTTTTTTTSTASTTSFCDFLCRIGQGGALCECESKPPAMNKEQINKTMENDSKFNQEIDKALNRQNFCQHMCLKGENLDFCKCWNEKF